MYKNQDKIHHLVLSNNFQTAHCTHVLLSICSNILVLKIILPTKKTEFFNAIITLTRIIFCFAICSQIPSIEVVNKANELRVELIRQRDQATAQGQIVTPGM